MEKANTDQNGCIPDAVEEFGLLNAAGTGDDLTSFAAKSSDAPKSALAVDFSADERPCKGAEELSTSPTGAVGALLDMVDESTDVGSLILRMLKRVLKPLEEGAASGWLPEVG